LEGLGFGLKQLPLEIVSFLKAIQLLAIELWGIHDRTFIF
jgi:hypothetical protein